MSKGILCALWVGLTLATCHFAAQGQTNKSVADDSQAYSSLSPKSVEALNVCVTYLNEVVFATRWLQQGLVAYNLHANYFHGVDFSTNESDGNLTFKAPNFVLPEAPYKATMIALRDVPPAYSNIISKRVDSVHKHLVMMTSLSKALTNYVNIQKYKNDNLEQSNQLLSQYEELFEELDQKCKRLYQLIDDIYIAHTPTQVERDAWQQSYQVLKRILDEEKNLYQTIKYQFKYRKDSSFALLTQEGAKLSDWIVEYQQDNPPPNIRSEAQLSLVTELYQDIFANGKIIGQKTEALEPAFFEDHITYERLTFTYNQSIQYFNKYVEVSEKPLLKYAQQIFLYRHLKIDEEQQPVATRITDTPLKWVSMDAYAPNHLILLLDVSSSMNKPEKLPLLKTSLKHLIPVMRVEDTLSIVVFSGNASVVLPPTSLDNHADILQAIQSLEPSGETKFRRGLNIAYDIAKSHYNEIGNNRVILATDGLFEVKKETLKYIKQNAKAGIRLTVFNFGDEENGIDKRLYKLARKGDGNYELIRQENSDFKLLKEVQIAKKTD